MASPQHIADLGRKIFQRLPQRNIPSGNKVISKQLKGEKVASWFNKPLLVRLGGDDPNFEILNEERLGKLDQMKRRAVEEASGRSASDRLQKFAICKLAGVSQQQTVRRDSYLKPRQFPPLEQRRCQVLVIFHLLILVLIGRLVLLTQRSNEVLHDAERFGTSFRLRSSQQQQQPPAATSDTMGANGQAVQTMNKKKVKLLHKKRAEIRNQKKVAAMQKGKRTVLRKHRPSKKKQQKDAKRHRIYVEAEKAKLLKSGVITKEDIEKMEAEQGDDKTSDDADAAMDVEE
ncbi:unnamed protein product [Phytophthora lilii]|uniref:Unnamed protein product n=1 Tax=Phytophthora lilii TaxID=2077276 RepID=A0A9W6WR79_9STRA|nr:unnamed protein product [Phytophthora lilii]